MDFYLGEFRVFPFNFAPKYWAQCNGQLMAISQNQALFSLLGTYYGGNGSTNFALPDLRGKVMVGTGTGNGMNLPIGSIGGTSSVTLNTQQLPQHNHQVQVINAQGSQPLNNQDDYLAQIAVFTGNQQSQLYTVNGYVNQVGTAVAIDPKTIGVNGGGAPHENMQPYSVLNVCIAIQGIYPSRN